MRQGKPKPRARKYIFLGYVDRVKGYRLWCPDGKSSNFLLVEVTFNEFTLFKEQECTDGVLDYSIRQQVKHEIQAFEIHCVA